MIKILNEVFHKTYKWSQEGNPLEIDITDFVNNYKDLKDDDLLSLLEVGYKLIGFKRLTDCAINNKYNKNNEIDKLLDNLGIQDIKSYPIKEQFYKFAIFENKEISESIIELDENNHADNIKYLIKSDLKNSEILI